MEADVAAGKVPAGAAGGSAKFRSAVPLVAVSEQRLLQIQVPALPAAAETAPSPSMMIRNSRRSSPVHTAEPKRKHRLGL